MKITVNRIAIASVIAAACVVNPAHAHRTYNVTGFASAGDGYVFSTNGSDGLWNASQQNTALQYVVAPTYSGGGGPSCGNATSGACPPASAGGSFYRGSLPVSWMTALHATANTPGEVFNLSTADALSVGPSTPANFQLAVNGNSTGTGMDFGYIRVDNAQNAPDYGIKITVSADAGSTLQPYLALFGGWDQSWTGLDGDTATLGSAFGSPSTPGVNRGNAYTAADNTLGSNLKFLYQDTNSLGLSTLSYFFQSPASGHFTVAIGGANGTAGNYTYSIETTAVPVPAAAWLFGGALSSLGLVRRRRQQALTA
jgi:hypothetical protein